jgi:hypothetical protein
MLGKTFAPLASVVLLGTAFVAGPAVAQQDIDQPDGLQLGSGIVCDTQAQMERFVSLIDEGADKAANAVNTEVEDPNACGYATMAFVRGAGMRTMLTKGGTYRIVELLVYGVKTSTGLQPVKPTSLYSLVRVADIEV